MALLASPFFTLRGLVAAVERKDALALERYINVPRVREGLRAELKAGDAEEPQGPLRRLGFFLGHQHGGGASRPSPHESLAALGTGQEPGQVSLGARNGRLRLQGLDRAFVYPKGNPSAGLVLERRGLRWRVVAIRLGSAPKASP